MPPLAPSYAKFVVSAAFLVGGTALFTYATTRTWTTERVLTRAAGYVAEFLEAKGLRATAANQAAEIDPEVDLESRQLLGQVHWAGGEYYWWNDARGFWGAGVLLFSVGCLVPFVGRRTLPGVVGGD